MQRIALVLFFLNFFVFSIRVQQTSISMFPDGSGRIHVDEPDGMTKDFRLSPKALDFTLATSIDLFIDADSRGAMTYNKFHGNDESVYLYQTAVGMSSEQIALMAKRQFEAHETTKDAYDDDMDRLARFDELSSDEVLALETGFRDGVQVEFEAKAAILNEVLTPEQLRLLDEIALVEDPLNFKAYEVLGLSEEQKRELEAIRQELMPEMKKDLMNQITAVRDFAKELLEKYIADVLRRTREKERGPDRASYGKNACLPDTGTKSEKAGRRFLAGFLEAGRSRSGRGRAAASQSETLPALILVQKDKHDRRRDLRNTYDHRSQLAFHLLLTVFRLF